MLTEPSRRPLRHHEWRIFPAAVVIAVGVLFLLNNFGYRVDFPFHGNGWALFILVGAIPPLALAYEAYRARGRLGGEAAYYLLGATAVVLVAVMFLAGLDWMMWWPLFVILGGLFTLVRGPYRHDRRRYRDAWDSEWREPRDRDDDARPRY